MKPALFVTDATEASVKPDVEDFADARLNGTSQWWKNSRRDNRQRFRGSRLRNVNMENEPHQEFRTF